MTDVTASRIQQLLDAARRLGAKDADVVVGRTTQFEVEVAAGDVETFSSSDSIGFGLRIFTPDHQMGMTYATVFPEEPAAIARAAWDNAQVGDIDEHEGITDSSVVSEDDLCEEDFSTIPTQKKVDFAMSLEQLALNADSCIRQVRAASYSDSRTEFTLANTNGLRRSFTRSACNCSVIPVAEDETGDAQNAWDWDMASRFDALDPERVVRDAVNEAVGRLGGRPCQTGVMPVVFDRYVTTQILSVLVSMLRASSVIRGKSLFIDKLGDTIASPLLTIRDQNDYPGAVLRAPFDGEGIDAQDTFLVQDGVLKTYLHNLYTARKTGAQSTANGVRGVGSAPACGPSNCLIIPGELSRDEIIARAGKGILVTQVMGMHTTNPVSGDFSVGLQGYRIENGEVGKAVRGVTIAGNIRDLLNQVQAVGNDFRMYGSTGAPSLLVDQLTIAGE